MRYVLLSSLLISTLASCAPPVLNAPAPALAPQLNRASVGLQSDEGVRKGVIELRKIRFQKWDKNISGFLTRDEVSDENMRIPGVIEGFHSYDTNGDGRIYMEEFLRDDVIQWWMDELRPYMRDKFLKFDTNRDFVLTGKEREKLNLFYSPWPKLNGGDLNKDGKITYSEYEDAYMTVLPFFQGGQQDTQSYPSP